MCKNRSKNEKGITILALVITIIVLLIIAGVSIAVLSGENGIINKYKDQAILSQLAIIEEAGNTIYLEGKAMGFDLTLNDIVNQLQQDGYDIKVRFGDGITGIKIDMPVTVRKFSGIYTIPVDREVNLSIVPDKGEIPIYYHAKVQEKYYEIEKTDNGIEINKTESNTNEWIDDYTVDANANNYISILERNTEDKFVKIKGIAEGTENINITYGKHAKEQEINVRSKLDYLNLLLTLDEFKDFTDFKEEDKTKFIKEGYDIHIENYTTIDNPSLQPSELIMRIGDTNELEFEYTVSQSPTYFAVFDGYYHEIVIKGSDVYADSTQKTLDDIQQENNLTVSSSNGRVNITETIKKENENAYKITIEAVNLGQDTLTVNYADKEKSSTIRVLSDFEYIEETDDLTGYTVEKVTQDLVDGLKLDYPTGMALNDSNKIKVTPILRDSTEVLYVLIGGKYYIVQDNYGELTVDTTPYDYDDIYMQRTLEANSSNTTIVRINGTINQSALEIPIASGSTKGTAVITVSYGGCQKTCEIQVKLMPTSSSKPNADNKFSTWYGTIEVIWLDTNNNVIEKPNKPEMYGNELTPVTWTKSGSTWTEDTTAQAKWYSYNAVTGINTDGTTVDNTTSLWANAKNTTDGSYFVWIPRYAYRITYYEKNSNTISGYYDGWGQWDADTAAVRYALDPGIETVSYNGNKYIVHPAFMDDRNKKDSSGNALPDYDRGGWDKDIPGFWVAKFETCQEENGISKNPGYSSGDIITTATIKCVSKPGIPSWRYIYVGTSYYNGYYYDRTKESHMIKNSEWGAIAYLTHSQYGRNGNSLTKNGSSTYTGGGKENAYLANGAQSTTGNPYGVYDMAGGSCDFVAIFNPYKIDENSYGTYMVDAARNSQGNYVSTKYVTVRYSDYAASVSNAYTEIFKYAKIGEASKEILRANNSYCWLGAYYTYINFTGRQFRARGGNWESDGTSKNIFGSDAEKGNKNYDDEFTFRIGLCP